MYEPLWQLVKQTINGERALEYTRRIWEHARWNSFDRMQKTADAIASIMTHIGMTEVEVRQYPADGTTSHGGWMMPHAWDVQDATLDVLEPALGDPILARYRDCPHSLMMYSAPTAPRGVDAELVVVNDASKAASWDGLDVRGKLVLINEVALDAGTHAFERGALGLVCDRIVFPRRRDPDDASEQDDFVQWHNYTVPPWRWDKKGFGFSITPSNGRRLRQWLAEGRSVKLRAVVATRLYDGSIPLVTGVLPGTTTDQIVFSGHLCEPGANDNASGCGVSLEAAGTIGELVKSGRLAPLQRGVRLVHTFEVRGYQAYLAEGVHQGHFTAGINLDMVGADQSAAHSICSVIYNCAALPAYTDVLALALAKRLQKEDGLFRFRTSPGGLVDNLFGDPAVGAPMCVFGNWPDVTYHSHRDHIDTLSTTMLANMGCLAATYGAFLAGAGFPEALWLARLTEAHGLAEIVDCARRLASEPKSDADGATHLQHVAQKNVARLRSIGRLVRPPSFYPSRQRLAQNPEALCAWSGLFKDEELHQFLDKLAGRLMGFARRTQQTVSADARFTKRARGERGATNKQTNGTVDADAEQRARRLVPVRTFIGSICFESLDGPARGQLKQRTGLAVSWGAPFWLHLALFWSNGKRTVWDIWQCLRHEQEGISLAMLNQTIAFLSEHDFVRLRPVVCKADLVQAIQSVGLPRGTLVMTHTSLSCFGYVEGGADTMIAAVLEAIGPGGTLVMPSFSFSWVGHLPYDPDHTPSRIGLVTNVFRQRAGVERSRHPTHALAALGPAAGRITSEPCADVPVFDRDGPFGRLYDMDAWVLMLCPIGANTIMHMAEHWCGVPFPDLVGHVLEGRRRRQVSVKALPWHANFQAHHDKLSQRDQLHRHELGEGTIHLMRARDAVDVAVENLREDPLMVTTGGCECDFCVHVRAQLPRE